jgi:hypothetical protein
MKSAVIDGHEYTLLRDRDQGNYKHLSFEGKVTYLDLRVNGILVSPCQTEMKRAIGTNTGLILVTAICAGISAASTFMGGKQPRKRGEARQFFLYFVEVYMPNLAVSVPGGSETWAEWLWRDVRSGLAHSFTIETGGMKLESAPYIRMANHGPEIHAPTLLREVADGWRQYLNDVRKDGQSGPLGKNFADRFEGVFHD